MDKILIEQSAQTPRISFDPALGEISLVGKSYSENVLESFKELLDALDEYASVPQKKTTINFKWLYYNTATSKIIIKILIKLKATETELIVNWYCKNDFTMMIEKANLIEEVMAIKINVIHD